MNFEIKHRFTGSVLFSLEIESLKLCVEAAVMSGAYLGGAYLGGADLGGADLRGAYLGGVKDVICAGIPREYWFHGWHKDGTIMVRGGCHSFTMSEAREYWSGKKDRSEIIVALDYIETIAKIRKWPININKTEAA